VLADERARSVYEQLRKDEGPFEANMQKIWDEHAKKMDFG
jgi:hypothetical protein